MHQQTKSSLIQIMACCMAGTKQLSDPMLEYWFDPWEQILIEMHTFSFKKMHLKMSSGNWWTFCLGLCVLNYFAELSSAKWRSCCSGSILFNSEYHCRIPTLWHILSSKLHLTSHHSTWTFHPLLGDWKVSTPWHCHPSRQTALICRSDITRCNNSESKEQ